MPIDSRTRMISFRLTEEEYEQFRQLCFQQGRGNLSEMARAGLKMILHEPSLAHTESLESRINELENRLRMLFLEVKRLTNQAIPMPSPLDTPPLELS